MATTTNTVRRFTDINLMFAPHPYSKDILTKKGVDAVKASIQNLILTKNYERPFHPEIGTQVQSLMFENFSPAVKIALERTIQETIELFEPRVRLIDISVSETVMSNDLVINIVFALRNTETPITLTTLLSRVR